MSRKGYVSGLVASKRRKKKQEERGKVPRTISANGLMSPANQNSWLLHCEGYHDNNTSGVIRPSRQVGHCEYKAGQPDQWSFSVCDGSILQIKFANKLLQMSKLKIIFDQPWVRGVVATPEGVKIYQSLGSLQWVKGFNPHNSLGNSSSEQGHLDSYAFDHWWRQVNVSHPYLGETKTDH